MKFKKINIVLIALICIVICFFGIYIISPFSMSKEQITLNCIDEDDLSILNFDIEIEKEDDTNYIILPKTIEDYQIFAYYVVEDDIKVQLLPNEKYEITNEQIDEGNLSIYFEKEVLESENIEIENIENIENEEGQEKQEEDIEENQIQTIENEEGQEKQEDEETIEENQIQTFALDPMLTFELGDGTSENPYKISTLSDLELLAYYVNNNVLDEDDIAFSKKYYEQTQDINLNNEEWTPIGLYNAQSTDYAFQGVYDGKGHKILNLKITISQMPSYKSKYGLFGCIYSADRNQRAKVCNIELENVNIQVTASGTSDHDLAIGTITGTLAKNSSVFNCIVNNANINVSSSFILGYQKMLAIGGVVGDSSSDPTENVTGYSNVLNVETALIENCISNANITVLDEAWQETSSNNRYYQFVLGGIIGRIRFQKFFPQNCVYQGTIKSSKAFIGPIYANLRYNVSSNISKYETMYLGFDDSGYNVGAMQNCYYYNYKIDNNSSIYNITNDYSSLSQIQKGIIIGQIIPQTNSLRYQGVNRGTYLEDLFLAKDMFNSYSGVGEIYNQWYFDRLNGKYTFEKTGASIEKIRKYNYTVDNYTSYNDLDLEFKWYLDEIEIVANNKVVEIDTTSIETRTLKVELIYNGQVIAIDETIVEKETLDVYLKYKKINDIAYVETVVTSTMDIDIYSYSYYWYTKDSSGNWNLEDENSYQFCIEYLEDCEGLKVVMENLTDSIYDKELYYDFESVVYVNNQGVEINGIEYEIGDDSNDGFSPQTPVRNISRAYEILSSNDDDVKNNIIVIMGVYDSLQTFECSGVATLTGMYGGIDWEGEISLHKKTALTLSGQTRFMDITFNGNGTDSNFYCQGNSLEMAQGIMTNNFTASVQDKGLISNNYPSLSILGGWETYRADILVPSSTCKIVIKSGCYSRVLGGGRSDIGAVAVFGTGDNPFNVEITVDIPSNDSSIGTYDNNIGLVVGGQADGSCFLNAKINILNGNIGRVIGGNLGFGRENDHMPDDTFFGSTILNLKGGTIKELFGGCLGRKGPTTYFYGRTQINLTGTTVEANVYGAGAGGTTGYSTLSSDNFKSWATGITMTDLDGNEFELENTQIFLNISDDAYINGNVFGAGSGYSFGLNADQIAPDGGCLYGDVFVNITGGRINGNVYGGAEGTNKYNETKPNLARVIGNININISGEPQIIGNVYGGSKGEDEYDQMGVVTGDVNINISDATLGLQVLTDIYGRRQGMYASVNGSTNVNISGSEIKGNIYGGGDARQILNNTNVNISDSIINTTTNIRAEDGRQVYGGGKGSNATVFGTTDVNIDNSVIYVRVCGGGNAGTVIGDTNVLVSGGSNVVKAVYGGGFQADIGTYENFQNDIFANTNVVVEDAIIGEISGNTLIGGEVFGGGSYGIVYGNTQATLGSLDIEIETTVGEVFYAGGRGVPGVDTVYGNSNALIRGMSTTLNSYGSIDLGNVLGDVNITFNRFRSKSATNRYEDMRGINKATNLRLIDSFIYLSEGLIEIENLYIPSDTGIMISEDSHISGSFYGGGELYLQNEVCLVINQNLYDDQTTSTITTLTINPELLEEEQYYLLQGSSQSPYIIILGEDYSSGLGMRSGNRRKYIIYNMIKDEEIPNKYITSCQNFISSGKTDPTYGTIYKSISEYDDRQYFYDDENNSYFIIDDNFEVTPDVDTDITSIYYIENRIIIPNYITIENVKEKDKKYISPTTDEMQDYIYLLANDSFTSDIEVVYSMVKNSDDNFYDPTEFTNLTKSICFRSNESKFNFPYGTSISMIVEEEVDGNLQNVRYTYLVKEQTDEILLTDFKNEQNQNYVSQTNIQSMLTQTNELVPSLWDTVENYRFIVDFSNCTDLFDPRCYDLTFETLNTYDGIESNPYTILRTNNLRIDNRNYRATLSSSKTKYINDSVIDITGKVKLDKISLSNISDVNCDIFTRFRLKDELGNYISFPIGTLINLNDQTYLSGELLQKITIENIEQNAMEDSLTIKIDMTRVPLENRLEKGTYYLDCELYLMKNDIIYGKQPLSTSTILLQIKTKDGIGIKLKQIQKNISQRNDEKQLINAIGTQIKNIKMQYTHQIGDDEKYINIQVYKREKDGQFNYILQQNTSDFVNSNNLEQLSNNNIDLPLTFLNTISNGTYRFVFNVLDDENNCYASYFINFVVKRNA